MPGLGGIDGSLQMALFPGLMSLSGGRGAQDSEVSMGGKVPPVTQTLQTDTRSDSGRTRP